MDVFNGVRYSLLKGKKFPLVLTQDSKHVEVISWAKQSKSFLKEKMSQYGAILFRGFNIDSISKFEDLAEACSSNDWVKYLEATSPRSPVESNTSTSTDYDQGLTIFPHNEKSYSGTWPHYIFFYCEKTADSGGETPLVDCRQLYKDIPQEIKKEFAEKKLMYVRQFSHYMGVPWKKAFNVANKEEMEAYCLNNYIDELTWKVDETPRLQYVRDVAIKHPTTGDACWFNHGTFFNIHAMEKDLREVFLSAFSQNELPYNTFYGNGDDISEDTIKTLIDLYYKNSVSFPYEKNDVIFVDNMLVAHGRTPFSGARRVLVTMTEHIDYQTVEKL